MTIKDCFNNIEKESCQTKASQATCFWDVQGAWSRYWLENYGETELFRANQLTLKEAIIIVMVFVPFMEWA
jgi:hypothetical protein